MDIPEETKEKVTQLQTMEQNLHSFHTQKQTFQTQLLEIDNALKELDTADGPVYKIVGTVMLASKKETLKKDLEDRKNTLNIRIQSLEKQETAIRNKAEKLQAEVIKEMEKKVK